MITFIPTTPSRAVLLHLIQLPITSRLVDNWAREIKKHIDWSPTIEQKISVRLFSATGGTFSGLAKELSQEYLAVSNLFPLLDRAAGPLWLDPVEIMAESGLSLPDVITVCTVLREVIYGELESSALLESHPLHLLALIFDWIQSQVIKQWEKRPHQADKVLMIGSMEIDHLHTLVEAVRSPVDLHPVFQSIVDRVRNSGIWPMCAIGLITDTEDTEILIPAQAGFLENYPRDVKFPAVGSATLETIRRKQPIAISDVASDTEFPVLQEAAKAAGYRSILLVPILVEGIKAVVTFGSPERHEFSSVEISLANAIAQQVMIAIENAYHYEHEKKRVEELESLNQLIAEKNRLLQRVTDTHTALTRLVLNGESLESILRAVRKLLGNPVTIENENFQLLCYSEDWEYFDVHRRKSIEAGRTVPEVITHPQVMAILNELKIKRRALLIPPLPSIGIEKRRIVAPIIAGGDIIGYVWVMEAIRSFDDQDLIITEQAALVLSLEMVKQRAMYETELRLKADFLDELFTNNSSHDAEILQKASYLGYHFSEPSLLLLVECSNPAWTGQSIADLQQRNRKIVLIVQEVINRYKRENIVALQSGQVLALVPLFETATDARMNSVELAAEIRSEVKKWDPDTRLLVGLGDVSETIPEMRAAYHQAHRALDSARNLGRLDETFHLSDLGIYGILYREGDKGELQAFAESSLAPLIQYDQQNGTELVKTLAAYLIHQGKLTDTARKLFIHVNTLRQRIERIEDVLHVSIDDPWVRLNLQLAQQIYEITTKGKEGGQPLFKSS